MIIQNKHLLRSTCFIGGKWVAADDASQIAVLNPANGNIIAEVANCGGDETTRAITAANEAWPAWRGLTAKQRAQILRRWFELILQNTEDLAQLITAEGGKPLAEARGEVAYGASFVEWFAEEGKRAYGETIPATATARLMANTGVRQRR